MEQSITICCSPKTYRQIRSDEKYRLQITKEAQCKFEGSYKEVIFTEKSESTPALEKMNADHIYTASNDGTINDDKRNWHIAPTKLMLSLVHEMRPNLGKSFNLKTKSKMFQIISSKMSHEGYCFTPTQIENRFRGLERRYNNNKKTGRNRRNCAYEDELDRILGEKKGIHPEYVLDSGDVDETSRSFSPQGVAEINNPSKDKEPTQICKKKLGVKEIVSEKIEELVVERKIFNAEILYLMKMKEQRSQRREERSEKKLELLERLLNSRVNNS